MRGTSRPSKHSYGLAVDVHAFSGGGDVGAVRVDHDFEQGLGDAIDCIGRPLTRGGALLKNLDDADMRRIVDFEGRVFAAQQRDRVGRATNAEGAGGGPKVLMDSQPGQLGSIGRAVWSEFEAWENPPGPLTPEVAAFRASVARGAAGLMRPSVPSAGASPAATERRRLPSGPATGEARWTSSSTSRSCCRSSSASA